MSKENLPDFSGKLVLFYTIEAPRDLQNGVLMKFISFADYGGKLFLTGRIPSLNNNSIDWMPNMQAAISWNDVTHFIIFDSQQDCTSYLRKANLSFLDRLFGLRG